MGNCAECFKGQNDDDLKKIDNDQQTKYDPLLDDSQSTQQGSDGPKSTYDQMNQNGNSDLTQQIEIENEDPQYKSKVQNKKISVADFDFLKVLGRGSFGKVLLVQRIQTKKLYAMKILKKGVIAQKNQIIHTKSERQILQNMNSPFIVQLSFAFQSQDKLYFVMDFMIGGELFFHLRRAYKFNEERSKLYCAELIAAIEYLHERNVIYRDLKPENILLGGDGHLKIADFGLSKQGVEDGVKTNTFCGTPEYLAPEILLGKGHDKSVDWYSLGCLLYEMLSGAPPFYSKDKHKMFRNRLERPIEMRQWFSPQARQIIDKLLQKDPTKRLGYNGAHEIKNHPFFEDIDWDVLLKKGYEPPFKPKVVNEKDLRHFDKMFTNEVLQDTPGQQNINQRHSHYDGFTYGGQTLHQSTMVKQKTNQNQQTIKEEDDDEEDEETKQPKQQQQYIDNRKTKSLEEDGENYVKDNEDNIDEDDDEDRYSDDTQQEDLHDDNLIEVNQNFSLKPQMLQA